jgi:hypothetical protein
MIAFVSCCWLRRISYKLLRLAVCPSVCGVIVCNQEKWVVVCGTRSDSLDLYSPIKLVTLDGPYYSFM